MEEAKAYALHSIYLQIGEMTEDEIIQEFSLTKERYLSAKDEERKLADELAEDNDDNLDQKLEVFGRYNYNLYVIVSCERRLKRCKLAMLFRRRIVAMGDDETLMNEEEKEKLNKLRGYIGKLMGDPEHNTLVHPQGYVDGDITRRCLFDDKKPSPPIILKAQATSPQDRWEQFFHSIGPSLDIDNKPVKLSKKRYTQYKVRPQLVELQRPNEHDIFYCTTCGKDVSKAKSFFYCRPCHKHLVCSTKCGDMALHHCKIRPPRGYCRSCGKDALFFCTVCESDDMWCSPDCMYKDHGCVARID